MPLVKITQERSKIRCMEKHKRTLAALGLRRINHFVIQQDTPQIRGMVHLVRYLVRVEPADAVTTAGGSAGGTAAARPRKKSAPKRAKKRTGGAKKMKSAAVSSAKSKARAASRARSKARGAWALNIKGKKRVPRS
jgi:large subunit ribosomal protein L30